MRPCAVAIAASILAGLWAKSSTTSTPPARPSDWKRRPTPWNRASGGIIAASSTPTAPQAATAASAFSTLWRPGTGRLNRTPAISNQVAPGDDGRVAPRAAQDLEDHRHDRGLAAGARHREGAVRRHEMGQQLRAMDHRYAARTRRGEVGHLLLDRGRDHERRGKLGRVREPRAVLGKDPDPEALELGA